MIHVKLLAIRLAAALIAFTATAGVSAQVVLSGKAAGVEVTIPKGWVTYTASELEEFNEQRHQVSKAGGKTWVDFAIRLKDRGPSELFPFLILTVQNAGEIPEAALEQLERIDISEYGDVSTREDAVPFSRLPADEFFFDHNNKRSWGRQELINNVGEEIFYFSSSLPTRRGFIKITGYSRSVDFDRHAELFRDVALSIKVPEEDQYDWGPSLQENTENVISGLFALIFTAVFCGLIALLAFLSSRSKRKAAERRARKFEENLPF